MERARDEFVSVYVTAGSAEDARKLARAMVERRLAACANLWPLLSVYRWEGQLKEEQEWALLFKTREDALSNLMAAILELHSDDIPCVVAWPWTAALPAYAAWVRAETS